MLPSGSHNNILIQALKIQSKIVYYLYLLHEKSGVLDESDLNYLGDLGYSGSEREMCDSVKDPEYAVSEVRMLT